MISMEMLGKIRRTYFRDKLSLHQISPMYQAAWRVWKCAKRYVKFWKAVTPRFRSAPDDYESARKGEAMVGGVLSPPSHRTHLTALISVKLPTVSADD